MREQLLVLIVVVPLMASLIAPLLAYLSKRLVRGFAVLAILVAHLSAVLSLKEVLSQGTLYYHFGGWAPPWGIEYVLDPLSAGLAVLISFISLMALIYSKTELEEVTWIRRGVFYALFLLSTTGLLGMIVTGDVFNLYVFLEISSLSTYALIASGGTKAIFAAFRYLVIGTIGGTFYLLGVGYLYAVTGTLNMADLAVRIQPVLDSPPVITAVALMIVGLGIKMALFPLHGWLPDAHTYAPTPISAIISGIMIKVPAYVMFRIFYFIMGSGEGPVPSALTVIGCIGAAGIIYGSIMAIAQKEFKRILAYSSMAQIGYIAVGFAIGNIYGIIGALFHILNHAVMKSCLFLIAGAVKWKTGEYTIDKIILVSKKLPITMGAFLVAAFSMVGLPPTAGFFSKWYLVLGAFEAGKWPFIVVIVLSSLLNAVYFFRIIENVYLRKGTGTEDTPAIRKLELPITMLVPILLLGAGILLIGVFNEQIIAQVIQYAVPGGGF